MPRLYFNFSCRWVGGFLDQIEIKLTQPQLKLKLNWRWTWQKRIWTGINFQTYILCKSLVGHHLKFCDVWSWWMSNFSNFWRAGTQKVNTFQPKRKLFLKIGTCKTLEIICKTQKNILGVCTIRPELGVFSKCSKYSFFVALLHSL